jgi:DNA (cytosine-5)-methyltransferase 1
MSKKYSDIKSKLKIEINKLTDNDLAHLTHFHNHDNGVSKYFE